MKRIKHFFLIIIAVTLVAAPVVAAADNGAVNMVPVNFTAIASKAKPAVVNIQTEKIIKGGGRVYRHFFGQPFGGDQNPFNYFFAPFFNQIPQNRKENSLGSGFIITSDGYIVTNNHVIKDADKIKVILYDKTEYEGTIVGTDPITDLALIKIKARNLTPLKFGNSSKAKVGSWVVAIGSPFGLEQTVTAGIISAKGRIIGSGPYDDFLQTDASINPGNSGGPLLNLKGEVIGINTAIIKSGQGIGFAIPSDLATGVIDQLKRKKSVSRGWMGVAIQNVTKQLAKYYGIREKQGVYVAKVYKGDPADKAGIRQGDVICRVNGKTIKSSRDLSMTIAGSPVGATVKVELIRNGKRKTVKVKLGKRPDKGSETIAANNGYDVFGLRLKPMNSDLARRLGYPEDIRGLVVMDVKSDSTAAATDVRQGDLLMEINHHRVKTIEQYQNYLGKLGRGDMVQLLFRRGNSHVFVISFEKP